MKKLFYLLFFAAVLATGCGKDDDKGCYDCKNANNEVRQTYCDVTEVEANSRAALWTQKTIDEESLSDVPLSGLEIISITIVRCDKQ
jgi:hypothetical protein